MTTPGAPIEDYQGALPDGWTGGQSVTKWWRGSILHLYKLARLCAECGTEMRIDVTRGALDGTKKNAGLHLTRCATCRARAKALGTSSRPRVDGQPTPAALRATAYVAAPIEPATAETIIATMKEELTGLYAANKELRKKLAKYEPESFPWGV